MAIATLPGAGVAHAADPAAAADRSMIWPAVLFTLAAVLLSLAMLWHAQRRCTLFARAIDGQSGATQIVNRKGRPIYSNAACRRLLASPRTPLANWLEERVDDADAKSFMAELRRDASAQAVVEREIRLRSGDPVSEDWWRLSVHRLNRRGDVLWSLAEVSAERQVEEASASGR